MGVCQFLHIQICHRLPDMLSVTAASSSAAPDERVVQRQALLRRLGLSTSHYLKLQPPTDTEQQAGQKHTATGTGQQHTAPKVGQQHTAPGTVHSPQVAIQRLLNTACICLMPHHLAYHWWSAPCAVTHPSPHQPQEAQRRAGPSPVAVPGQVEVQGVSASPLGHNSSNNSSSSSAGAGDPSLALQGKAPMIPDATPGWTPSQRAQAAAEAGAVPPEMPEEAAVPLSAVLASPCHPGLASCPQADTGMTGSPTDNDGGPFVCSPVHVQLQVLHSLRRLLTSKLDAIAGGTAEEDRSLAQQPGCSPAAGMALGYRAGQKQIAAAALAALASTAAEVVQRAAARLGVGSRQPSSPGEVRHADLAMLC